jgi:hypothetical protein
VIWRRRRKSKLTRVDALEARPRKRPIVRRRAQENGKVRVTVELTRPGWTRWLGGGGTFERTFALDAYGVEVYDACDGQRTVRTICRRFAKGHKVSIGEAEGAVTQFLRTLMGKGLIEMVINRDEK